MKKTPLDQIDAAMMREFTLHEMFNTISKCQRMRMQLLYNIQMCTALIALPAKDANVEELTQIIVDNLWKSEQLLIRIIELKNQQSCQ